MGQRYPDSEDDLANIEPPLGPTGPRWASYWPHQHCYQGILVEHWATGSQCRTLWYCCYYLWRSPGIRSVYPYDCSYLANTVTLSIVWHFLFLSVRVKQLASVLQLSSFLLTCFYYTNILNSRCPSVCLSLCLSFSDPSYWWFSAGKT